MSFAWMPAIDQNRHAAILAFGKVAVYRVKKLLDSLLTRQLEK